MAAVDSKLTSIAARRQQPTLLLLDDNMYYR
jgi:hypothetical protein